MATWHQLRRPVRLDHDTQWTVVSDPPHALRTSISFTLEADARAFHARNPQHAYILPPRPRPPMKRRKVHVRYNAKDYPL